MSQDFHRYQQGLTSTRGFEEILYLKENVEYMKSEDFIFTLPIYSFREVRKTKEDKTSHIMLMYSGGLRERALGVLKKYPAQYKSERWFFKSARPEKYIPTRTAQAFLKKACKKPRIKREVSTHSLRYSFVTYLLEIGVNLKYTQEIFSHKSSKTTETHTQVSKANIASIKSLLDTILRVGEA